VRYKDGVSVRMLRTSVPVGQVSDSQAGQAPTPNLPASTSEPAGPRQSVVSVGSKGRAGDETERPIVVAPARYEPAAVARSVDTGSGSR